MDAVLDALTANVLDGDDTAIAAFFTARDADPSIVAWSPPADDIGECELQFLMRFWHARRSPGGLLPPTAIDPLALRPALGFIMLLDVIDGGADFRYSLSRLVLPVGRPGGAIERFLVGNVPGAWRPPR